MTVHSLAAPTFAAGDELLQTFPAWPAENQPFRLVLSGVFGFLPQIDEVPTDVELDAENDEVVVTIGSALAGLLDPPSLETFTVPVGPLPAGFYDVTVRTFSGLLVTEGKLFVAGQYVTGLRPGAATAGEPFEIVVSSFASAPAVDGAPLSGPGVTFENGVFWVPWIFDASVVSPPPPPRPQETKITLPAAPAGRYPIVLRNDFDRTEFFRGEIEILDETVRLQDGLFAVDVSWRGYDGATGRGMPARPPSEDSALFWFFGADNWELMVKVLDGCFTNGHYWVLGAAATDVEYEVEVRGPGDQTVRLENPLGNASSAFILPFAFPCGEGADSPASTSSSTIDGAVSWDSVSWDSVSWDSASRDAASRPAAFEKAASVQAVSFEPTPLSLEPNPVSNALPVRSLLDLELPDCGRVDLGRVQVGADSLGPSIQVDLLLSEPDPFSECETRHLVPVEIDRLRPGLVPVEEWVLQVREIGPDGQIEGIYEQSFELTSPPVALRLDLVGTSFMTRHLYEDEALQLHFRGPANCPPEASVQSIRGGMVRIARDLGTCGDAPGFYTNLVTLEPLPKGAYRLQIHDYGIPPSVPQLRGEVSGGTTFEVFDWPLSIAGGRFGVEVDWQDFGGKVGRGRPVERPQGDSALFWFFGPDNWELMVKVLDGCALNGHYWVFGAASTNVAYDLRVVDRETGADWTFENPLGMLSPAITDVEAFPCDDN